MTANRIKKSIAACAIAGAGLTGLGASFASPASAATDTQGTGKVSVPEIPVNIDIDPQAITHDAVDAVNSKSDRGGAVRAALDSAYFNAKNTQHYAMAVINENQEMQVSGEATVLGSLDIKHGNYVLIAFSGPGKIENHGDGGWINWGAEGNINMDGKTMHINGG